MTSTRPSWWWALRMEKLMAPSFSFMIKHFVIYRQWPGYHAGCPRPLGKDVSVRHCPITVVALSSSAFDQGLLTVSGNLVQLIDASEFADNDDDENREDGGRWLSWLFFNEAMGWAYECLHLRNGDNDRINGTTAFNFKCMFIN